MRATVRRLPSIALAVTMGLAACSSGGAKKPNANPRTATTPLPAQAKMLKPVQAGKLTACTSVPNPPYSVDEGGKLGGIDADLVRAIGGRLALTGDFVVVPPDQQAASLAAARCDILVAQLWSEGLLKGKVAFSRAYLAAVPSILVRKADASPPKDLGGLKGRKVGVVTGSAVASFAAAHSGDGGFEVVGFPTSAAAQAALSSAAVGAVLDDFAVDSAHAATASDTVVAAALKDDGDRHYAVAVAKGKDELLADVNKALDQVTADDTFPTVLRTNLGDAAGQYR